LHGALARCRRQSFISNNIGKIEENEMPLLMDGTFD